MEQRPVITDQEFDRAGGGRRGAIEFAMGAASTCWERADLMKGGVFLSERCAQVAADLDRYLDRRQRTMTQADAAWLEVLIDHAVPRSDTPSMNWEGRGREHAKRILRDIIEDRSPSVADR